MKTPNMHPLLVCLIGLSWVFSACADRGAEPPRPEPAGEPGKGPPAEDTPVAKPAAAASLDDPDERRLSGLVNLEKSAKLLEDSKYEELLDAFQPRQVSQLTAYERQVLGETFYQAAVRLRNKFKNISFSSLYCERGLMLVPDHQLMLRLQVRNYLHTDMKLFGGAEELAKRLLEIDPNHVENQLLRGKIAFDQGEYGDAIVWLKKAARVGRRQRGKIIEEAWQLLDLAKGKEQEIKASLSMTKELEVMLARARTLSAKTAETGDQGQPEESVALSGGTVTLYMTRWCKYCSKARSLLKSMKVRFEEKDIERDETALMEMMRYAETAGVEVTGVPVLRIGSKMVVGYNPQRIENLVDQIR